MNALINHLTILSIVFFIIIVTLAIFGVIKVPSSNNKDKKTDHTSHVIKSVFSNDNSLTTCCMNFLILEQLDHNDNVIQQYDLSNIPEKGLIVGRADDCDIKITTSHYVGRHHCVIAKDTKGVFVQDTSSKNGLYDNNETRSKQIDLPSGTCFYVADIKLRVKTLNPFDKSKKSSPLYSKDTNGALKFVKISRM